MIRARSLATVRTTSEAPPLTVTKPSPDDWRVNNFDLIRLLAASYVAVVHALMHLKPSGYLVLMVRFGPEQFGSGFLCEFLKPLGVGSEELGEGAGVVRSSGVVGMAGGVAGGWSNYRGPGGKF